MVEVGSDKTVSSLPSQDVKVSWSFLVQGAVRGSCRGLFDVIRYSNAPSTSWRRQSWYMLPASTASSDVGLTGQA